jgi:eukaryotic-like serine/threonine-protein kinase
VWAFDASSGASLWSFATGGAVRSSPAIVDGVVYAGSSNGFVYAIDAATGTLYAFRASSGRELWTSGWGNLTRGITSSPAVSGAKVYVGVRDGSLYAFGR